MPIFFFCNVSLDVLSFVSDRHTISCFSFLESVNSSFPVIIPFVLSTVGPPRLLTQSVRNSKGAGSTSAALIFKGCEKFKACSDVTLCAFVEQLCCDDVSSLPPGSVVNVLEGYHILCEQ